MPQRAATGSSTTPPEVSQLSASQLANLVCTQATTIDSLQQQLDGLKHQLEWFKRQIFGQKSERLAPEPDPSQLPLAAVTTPVERPWLTQVGQQAIRLLEPIYDAQLDSIRRSRVIAMDETPIKAGRNGQGSMKTGYFWPVYGEHDEVCFPFFTSRATQPVRSVLGLTHTAETVLVSDGYAVYQRYAKQTGLTHAQCWAHTRRGLFEAQALEPQLANDALLQIQALYAVEDHIRQHKLAGESKKLHRLTYSKPIVDSFFEWIDRQFQRHGLLPSNPFTKALAYARERRLGLEVFLTDPDADRHEPSGARAARDSNGTEELELLLD